jgi:hypothetical protein
MARMRSSMIPKNPNTVRTNGNTDLLHLPKTAFVCSRTVPALAVLKCYNWAIEQREQGNCVLSGFHSQIEKDVLHYLLKGAQPIIVALARGLKEKVESEFEKPLKDGRLLMISPFDSSHTRVTQRSAHIRNAYMIELADTIAVGYASPTGQLTALLRLHAPQSTKPIVRLHS